MLLRALLLMMLMMWWWFNLFLFFTLSLLPSICLPLRTAGSIGICFFFFFFFTVVVIFCFDHLIYSINILLLIGYIQNMQMLHSIQVPLHLHLRVSVYCIVKCFKFDYYVLIFIWLTQFHDKSLIYYHQMAVNIAHKIYSIWIVCNSEKREKKINVCIWFKQQNGITICCYWNWNVHRPKKKKEKKTQNDCMNWFCIFKRISV